MPKIHRALFGVSILMFLVSASHLALVIHQIAVAPKLPKANLRTRIVLAALQFMLGDIVFIWRVWVVWGHNYWVAIGPFITMVIAAAFVLKTAPHLETKSPFLIASVAMIVANTATCTLLIAGRIWYARYQVRQISGGGTVYARGLSRTIILFIETGALITASQVISLILNVVNSPGIHILLDLQNPLIGILPTLIIVIVHFELVRSPATVTSRSSQSHGLHFEARHVAQLDTFVSSTAHSEETGRSTKPKGIDMI